METMSQMYQLYMTKKAICVLLSLVSVLLFVLVSYSSLFLPLLSTFSINFFNYSSERNYIFLLCNGILVFLIKNSANSALVADHTKYITPVEKTRDEVDEEEERTQNKFLVSVSEKENSQNKLLVSVSEKENSNPLDKNEEKKQEHLLDIQEDDNNYFNDNSEERKEDGEENADDDDDDEEEEEEEEEREKLNKRCEEFIRKMKQNIKTEAARQLILIN